MPVATQSYPIPGDLVVTAPADLKLLTPYVLTEQGDWFEPEIRFVRRLLQPGMGVADIGANFGLYTLTAARAVGPTGRVVAFEPASLPRSCLARSLQANGLSQVELHGTALSNREGTAHLALSDNSELNHLGADGLAGETVPLTTLDAASDSWTHPVHFLKLDAEGEEIHILECARRFFATHDPLVMFEHHHGDAVNTGHIQAFRAYGFAIFRHLPGLNVLVPHASEAVPDAFLLNIFACRPAMTAQLAAAGLLLPAPAPIPPPLTPTEAIALVGSWLKGRPWVSELWPNGVPSSALPGHETFLPALADVRRSEASDEPPDRRWAFALRALAGLRAAIDQQATPARLFTAARVALALGERALAVNCLLQTSTTASPDQLAPEPFLPPEPRFDDLDPAGNLPAALAAMRDEPLLEYSAFSVYYARKKALPMLLRLARNPLRSPAANRRLTAARHLLPLGPI
jgi:FkbM family methyltransferase